MKVDAGITVRDARPEELGAIGMLLKEAYQQYSGLMTRSEWESYLEDIMDVKGRILESDQIVAEEHGQLVGAVTLYLDGTRVSWPPGWSGVRLLGVPPEHRGKGIGRALMDECLRRCRAAGIATIGLHTTEAMAVAKGMYERMGFLRVPQFDHRPAPEVVVMAYRLDL